MKKMIPARLFSEWSPQNKKPLSAYTYGSHFVAQWVCARGHSWPAAIKSRVAGANCPYCSGRLPIIGETDLATVQPGLLQEWDYEKNAMLPSEVTAYSNKHAWWICRTCEQRWETVISHRSNGKGCPYCAGKVPVAGGSFGDQCPELAKEWHPDNMCTPYDVTVYSNKQAKWICSRGHEWIARIGARVQHGSQCPYCTGKLPIAGETDLATVNPGLAAEWDYEHNGDLTPYDVLPYSSKRVFWVCRTCGASWQATVRNRSNGKGCRICFNKKRSGKIGG